MFYTSEFNQLIDACRKFGVSLRIVIREVPAWVINGRPDREMHFCAPFGIVVPELTALHEALWQRGERVSLELHGVTHSSGVEEYEIEVRLPKGGFTSRFAATVA